MAAWQRVTGMVLPRTAFLGTMPHLPATDARESGRSDAVNEVTERHTRLPVTLVLSIFVPFAAGYFLSYVYRTINSVVAPEIEHAIGVNAAGLGLLTSTFFLAFAAAQLPLGVLLDRFGPRRVEALLLIAAAAGVAVFGAGHSLPALAAGRALIGLGASACMMAAFKAFVQWFDVDRLPLVNGFLLGFGATGALAATVPVQWALGFTGWREIFFGLAAITLLVATALWLVVPDHDEGPAHTDMASQVEGIRAIFKDRFFWRVTPLAAVAQGCFLGVQGLWAGPWLHDVAHLGPTAMAGHLGAMALAIITGFFIIGSVAGQLMRRGVTQAAIIGWGVSLFTLVLASLALGLAQAPLLTWIAFGFLGSSSLLAYSALSAAFPKHLAGRVNTALNLIVFIAAFVIQWGMGEIINLWRVPGTQAYGAAGYQAAFAVLTALQLAALLWFALPRRERP